MAKKAPKKKAAAKKKPAPKKKKAAKKKSAPRKKSVSKKSTSARLSLLRPRRWYVFCPVCRKRFGPFSNPTDAGNFARSHGHGSRVVNR